MYLRYSIFYRFRLLNLYLNNTNLFSHAIFTFKFEKKPRMDVIEITEGVLDVNNISQMVTDPSCGAVSIFVGNEKS